MSVDTAFVNSTHRKPPCVPWLLGEPDHLSTPSELQWVSVSSRLRSDTSAASPEPGATTESAVMGLPWQHSPTWLTHIHR